MKENCSNKHRPNGFSLVELMVVLAIMTIVGGVAYSVFASLTMSYTTQNVAAKTQLGLRIGVDTIARDIRMAGLDPLNSAGAKIVTSDSTTIQFTSDKNMDGDVDDPAEDITYALAGNVILYTDNLGSVPVIENVSDFSFTYFDSDGSITSITENIRSVHISLTTSAPAGRAEPVTRRYTTLIRCRNIGL